MGTDAAKLCADSSSYIEGKLHEAYADAPYVADFVIPFFVSIGPTSRGSQYNSVCIYTYGVNGHSEDVDING